MNCQQATGGSVHYLKLSRISIITRQCSDIIVEKLAFQDYNAFFSFHFLWIFFLLPFFGWFCRKNATFPS